MAAEEGCHNGNSECVAADVGRAPPLPSSEVSDTSEVLTRCWCGFDASLCGGSRATNMWIVPRAAAGMGTVEEVLVTEDEGGE